MDIDFAASLAPRDSTKVTALTVATAVARILLGIVFFAAGVSGFVFLFVHVNMPAQPGLAGAFQDVFFRSHWVQFVDGVELIAGALLLANRYLTLALTLLGAVIANILFFHLSLQPQTIPVPLVALALWGLLAWRYRAGFAPLWVRTQRPA